MFEPKEKIKVLVVDDDGEVLKTLKKILLRRGYEVLAFESPVEALERLKAERVDLILTDLKMPQMDGVQFVSRAKEIHPRTPVILVTGYATVETAVAAVKWGAFDYLCKPFEIKKIYEVIDNALKSGKGGTYHDF